MSLHEEMNTVETFWELLRKVRSLRYTSVCGVGSKTGWDGSATGSVEVDLDPEGQWIHFYERCDFRLSETGAVFDLKNQYRWTRVESGQRIRLDHWRRGVPVHLLELEAKNERKLGEVEAHLCVADTYKLSIELREDGFNAVWKISGPKKDETLSYEYLL